MNCHALRYFISNSPQKLDISLGQQSQAYRIKEGTHSNPRWRCLFLCRYICQLIIEIFLTPKVLDTKKSLVGGHTNHKTCRSFSQHDPVYTDYSRYYNISTHFSFCKLHMEPRLVGSPELLKTLEEVLAVLWSSSTWRSHDRLS